MLTCTAAPLTPVCALVPNEAGDHIALVSDQAVSAMTLPRNRGEHGEFGGGKKVVTCRYALSVEDRIPNIHVGSLLIFLLCV